MPARPRTAPRRTTVGTPKENPPPPAPAPPWSDDTSVLAGLKAMGAPAPGRTLAIGWRDPAACAAVRTRFKPTELTWIGPAPAPAPRNLSRAERLADLPTRAVFDLVVVGPDLATGSLASARSAIADLAARLAPGGCALLALDGFAACDDPRAPLDAVLFPALAASGSLGEAARRRPALGPAAWLLMLFALGLKPEATAGYGEAPLSVQDVADHGPRLDLIDERELTTPRLLVRAVRQGRKR